MSIRRRLWLLILVLRKRKLGDFVRSMALIFKRPKNGTMDIGLIMTSMYTALIPLWNLFRGENSTVIGRRQRPIPKGHPAMHVPAGRADCVRQSIDYTIPEKITLGLDYTCNLHCASCRDHTQVATGEQLRIREVFADEIIKTGWLEKTKELELSGSGEALFSKIDRKILFANEKCKRNSISLMSND